ncbi:MAG: extracellular solute-binding protein [Pseudodesulfovibrio sp.]
MPPILIIPLACLLFLAALPQVAENARAHEGPELVFLHYWTDALNGGIDEMTQAYNRANPGNPVRAAGFEHESFKQSIALMIEGDSTPDLFSYWAGDRARTLVERGDLAPIDTVWADAGLDKVFPAFVNEACTYDGRKYALPLTLHYVAFFYNKEVFRRHGVTPPATWEQFTAACRTLRAAEVTPVALGCRERWPAQFWFDYLLLRTAGPDYRERLMRGEAGYDDPEVSRALCQWRQLLEAGFFSHQSSQLDWAEAAGLVRSGNAAMTLIGTWVIGLFDGKLGWRQEADYDFFPFPTMDADVPRTALGAIDVVMVPRRGRPDRVSRALAYFSDPGPQMAMSRGSGALSPSLAVPPSFYSPLKRRILETVRTAPRWAFNYDLSTPPAVARLGLDSFKLLVDAPADLREIQPRLAGNARRAFAGSRQ